jgi:phage-related protein
MVNIITHEEKLKKLGFKTQEKRSSIITMKKGSVTLYLYSKGIYRIETLDGAIEFKSIRNFMGVVNKMLSGVKLTSIQDELVIKNRKKRIEEIGLEIRENESKIKILEREITSLKDDLIKRKQKINKKVSSVERNAYGTYYYK